MCLPARRGYFARSVGLAVTAVAGEAIPAAGLQLQDTADGTRWRALPPGAPAI